MQTNISFEQAIDKLNGLHIQLTPLRYAVLEAMHEPRSARPTVEELCRRLSPRFPRVNATAVRNAVLVFDKMGLLPSARPASADRSQAG